MQEEVKIAIAFVVGMVYGAGILSMVLLYLDDQDNERRLGTLLRRLSVWLRKPDRNGN